MKLVTMTTDLKPYHRGQHVPFPDEVADGLIERGEAINPRPFRGAVEAEIADLPMLTTPLRPDPPPETKPRRRYLTK
jgi:hypothetical protein